MSQNNTDYSSLSYPKTQEVPEQFLLRDSKAFKLSSSNYRTPPIAGTFVLFCSSAKIADVFAFASPNSICVFSL